ncbi:putative major pilin subunit [Limihaloglobus sulfuriphilus]|uniref:Putative major pilin subunit n=1 Tax=Limihaloglobus sulfuriphilus TaxID=1851148 RepID=A0A1Q2MAZ4_9BACT|nr:type II secretion system protein [Limihaloglobus sulfuriphilus]AQQ69856.1 putative major pilin subunit [Limihaloglobus sulfuriphilus]
MKFKKGFTLIELLVVISIIALLMAIMLPALGRARELAKMVVCRSNLKTLVIGSILWSEDNDGWAIAGDWYKDPGENEKESSICPYVEASKKTENDSFVCPSANAADFFQVDPNFSTDAKKFTYAANGYICLNLSPYNEGSPGTAGPSKGSLYGYDSRERKDATNIFWTEHGVTKIVNIRQPQETVYFIDHEYYQAFSWTFNPHKDPLSFSPTYRFRTRWHQKKADDWYGKGNIAWVDGHVTVEPDNFEQYRKPDTNKDPWWRYYFYDH